MSHKGNCRDNASTESWISLFKNKLVQGLRFAPRAEMPAASM